MLRYLTKGKGTMIRFSDEQTSLFDFAYGPVYDRAKDPDLEKVERLVQSAGLMDRFRLAFLEKEKQRAEREEKSLIHRGRPTHPVDVMVKLLILRRLYGWSFRQTEKMANDSISVRKFLGLTTEAAPDHSDLCRWNRRIPEELWKELNRSLVAIAKQRKITRGRKMRVDTTVVEANIHYPTDSSLLMDSVRKLGQLARRVRALGLASGEQVRDFSRSAKKQLLAIVKVAQNRTGEAGKALKQPYERLVKITKRAVSHAKRLEEDLLAKASEYGCRVLKEAERIVEQYETYLPRMEHVIDQTVRRVWYGEKVPASEKIVSIHEPHAYVIRRGKRSKPTEFGRVARIQEADGGIITDWEVYASKPADSNLLLPSVDAHREVFGKLPFLAAADRGFWDQGAVSEAESRGVKRVCVPKRGKKSQDRAALERQRWFRLGQRFRAGSEGSISVLKRKHGMDRSLDRAPEGMDKWVGQCCVAKNVWLIAHAIS